MEGIKIRIITVNLPISYIKAIDSLTGQKGLYPSRSELIRVAIREFLLSELEAAKKFEKYQIKPFINCDTQAPDIYDSKVESKPRYRRGNNEKLRPGKRCIYPYPPNLEHENIKSIDHSNETTVEIDGIILSVRPTK